jgi:hypothetical protein
MYHCPRCCCERTSAKRSLHVTPHPLPALGCRCAIALAATRPTHAACTRSRAPDPVACAQLLLCAEALDDALRKDGDAELVFANAFLATAPCTPHHRCARARVHHPGAPPPGALCTRRGRRPTCARTHVAMPASLLPCTHARGRGRLQAVRELLPQLHGRARDVPQVPPDARRFRRLPHLGTGPP